MKQIIYFSSLILIFFVPPLFSADKAAIISRDTSLFFKPFKDADTITELSAQTTIVILKRKGGWYEIKTATQQGWVRLTHVRLARKIKPASGANNNIGYILSGLATGRDKSDEITTATAIKGLGEEELRNAKPDFDALNALDNFAISENTDDNSGLQTRTIDYLDGDELMTKKIAPNEDDE